jgi:hypothetical protein
MTPELTQHLREIGVLPVPAPRPAPAPYVAWAPSHPGEEPPF